MVGVNLQLRSIVLVRKNEGWRSLYRHEKYHQLLKYAKGHVIIFLRRTKRRWVCQTSAAINKLQMMSLKDHFKRHFQLVKYVQTLLLIWPKSQQKNESAQFYRDLILRKQWTGSQQPVTIVSPQEGEALYAHWLSEPCTISGKHMGICRMIYLIRVPLCLNYPKLSCLI